MMENSNCLSDRITFENCPICTETAIQLWRTVKGWPLCKCVFCGVVFANPMPTEQALTAAYSLPKDQYDDFFKTDNLDSEMILGGGVDQHRSDRAVRFLNQLEGFFPDKGALLELGCGSGAFLETAQKRGWDTVGVDPGDWHPDKIRDKGLNIQRTSLFEADILVNSFDVIFLSSVLEHVCDPMRYLSFFYDLLRPGGILLVVGLPNVKSWTISLHVDKWIGNHPPQHLFFFSPNSIRRAFNLAGFIDIKLNSFGLSETLLEMVFNKKGRKYSGDYASIVYKKDFKSRLLNTIRSMLYQLFNLTGTGSVLEVLARKPVK